MRTLIRPALFMIARLGLFLAVVVWAVAQWWTTTVPFSVDQHTFFCSFSQSGFLVQHLSAPADVVADHGPHVVSVGELDLGEFFDTTAPPRKSEWRKTFSNGAIFCHSPFVWWCSCRHWLVITIFALFNGVLTWVYRKRGKEMADE